METSEFEREAMAPANTKPELRDECLSLAGMGLCGEAGEVTDLLKKHVHHDRPADPRRVLVELGDVLWYVTYAAHCFGFTLEDVMRAQVAKLHARFPEGKFSPAAAEAKADEKPWTHEAEAFRAERRASR